MVTQQVAPEQEQTLAQSLTAFKSNLGTLAPPEVIAQFDAEIERLVRSGLAEHTLKVGQVAPDFTLPDMNGKAVTLSALLAYGPVALVFYRGAWCPYCNIALRAYQHILPQIASLGGALVAVSPQTPDHSLTMAEKAELTFPLLSDQGNVIARQYGLVYAYAESIRPLLTAFGSDIPAYNGDSTWELPFAGVFVIAPDRTLKMVSVDPDWTKRPEPEAILSSLRALAGR